MNTPLHFIEDDELYTSERQAGDAKYHEHAGRLLLQFVCPGCMGIGAISLGGDAGWQWNSDRTKPTATPSILHDHPRCGWHGYLTNGELVSC